MEHVTLKSIHVHPDVTVCTQTNLSLMLHTNCYNCSQTTVSQIYKYTQIGMRGKSEVYYKLEMNMYKYLSPHVTCGS
jgi:hypothetical protein